MKAKSVTKILAIWSAAICLMFSLTTASYAQEGNFTPGFWKNDVSASYWEQTGIDPNSSFPAVFNIASLYSPTLMDMLNAKGGGTDALGRHAVAALLNASLPNSTYPYSAEEIKTAVCATLTQFQIASLSTTSAKVDETAVEDLKDIYEALNENRR